jgi:hypothetical protein
MLIAAMDRRTNVDQDQLQAELARSRVIQHAFQVDSLTILNQQKGKISDHKKQIKLEINADMAGDSNKKCRSRKEYQCRRKTHAERKKARGGQKDPLTQESYASDFEDVDGLEAQEPFMTESIEEIKYKLKSSTN